MRSLDLETYLFCPGLAAPKMVCGQVGDDEGEQLLTPPETLALLRKIDQDCEELGFANAPFDLSVACALDPALIPVVFSLLEKGLVRDTHTRQPLLDIGRGSLLVGGDGQQILRYSLQNIVAKTLGQFVAKENTPRLFYAHLDGVPFNLWTTEQREYALKDARVTRQAIVAQGEGDPEDPGIKNLQLEKAENRANFALHLMRCWGPRTDPVMVEDVTRAVTAAHEAAIAKFTEAGIYRGEGWCRREKREELTLIQCPDTPHRHDPNACWKPWLPSKVGTKDGAWLQRLVEIAYQGQPPRTESGGVSTDRDTLLESGDPLLMELGEAGANETEWKTYLDVVARGTSVPICVEYDILKRTTRTGARNPNLQNLPRLGRTRECFVARPGTVWCSVDMPSLELVTLAQNLIWMFGSSTLAEILRDKIDPHVNLASRLMGITYAEGLKLHKAKDPRMKLMRQASKPVNYGMGGGMGAEKLVVYCRQPSNGGVKFCEARGLKHNIETYFSERLRRPVCRGCVEVATEFRNAWFEMLPEMRDYFDVVSRETEDPDNALIECRGPEGEPSLWVRGRRFSEAANLRFQSLAARMMKDALWRVAKACYWETQSLMYDCRPVMFVHDEIMVECPEDLASDAGFEQARLMTEAARHWCPDVPCVPEPALQRRWFKGAELVKDKAGKLVPWWPDNKCPKCGTRKPDGEQCCGKEVGWSWLPDQEVMRNDRARKASKV